jgi:hypothetical protein
MARPIKFPNRIEFWTNDLQLQGLELLCSDGLTDKASHMRQALAMYLRACGIIAASRPAQPVNGAHHQEAGAHNV